MLIIFANTFFFISTIFVFKKFASLKKNRFKYLQLIIKLQFNKYLL